MQAKGLEVKSVFGDFIVSPLRMTNDPKKIGAVDLVLFCTKTYDTDEAANCIIPLVGKQTSVMSLQNGVDAAERVGSVLGTQHILGGTTWISSAIERPGVIRQMSDFRRIVLGELDGNPSQRAETVYQTLSSTGITVELSRNILQVLWTKFVFIAAVSAMGSLTRLPLGDYRAVPEARELATRLMDEVVAVGRAEGVTIEGDVVQQTLAFIDKAAPQIKPSMQVDVENGRRTELESLIGVIGRRGRRAGVSTPATDMVYAVLLPLEIKARESHNRGE